MKKVLIAAIFIPVIFAATACSGGRGKGRGDIEVINARRLSLGWLSLWSLTDYAGIDGVQVWRDKSPRGEWFEHGIIRIDTYSALADFLEMSNYWNWQELREDETEENITDIYTLEFFDTRSLVIVTMTEGVLTAAMKVDSITEGGVINMTRTQYRAYGPVELLGIDLTLGIETGKSFNPSSMTVNMTTREIW